MAAGGSSISPRFATGQYVGTPSPRVLARRSWARPVFVPVTIGAMSGVVGRESGVASGLITTTQQIGRSFRSGGALDDRRVGDISQIHRFARAPSAHERSPASTMASPWRSGSARRLCCIGAVVAFAAMPKVSVEPAAAQSSSHEKRERRRIVVSTGAVRVSGDGSSPTSVLSYSDRQTQAVVAVPPRRRCRRSARRIGRADCHLPTSRIWRSSRWRLRGSPGRFAASIRKQLRGVRSITSHRSGPSSRS